MSDTVARKDQLTAWQRWELPAFDKVQAVSDGTSTVSPPTAAQLEQMHLQAHEEGYRAGYAEGEQRARDEEQKARDAEQKASAEAQRLAEMISALDLELQQVDQQVAQNLLDLSLEIARQMLQQALKVKPELLLGVVREAISDLPHFNQHAHLVVHPADAVLLRANMGEQLNHTGWKILEDAQMERGGCRVETAHSQIDATLSTRWKRVVSAIGQDSTWLES